VWICGEKLQYRRYCLDESVKRVEKKSESYYKVSNYTELWSLLEKRQLCIEVCTYRASQIEHIGITVETVISRKGYLRNVESARCRLVWLGNHLTKYSLKFLRFHFRILGVNQPSF